MTTPTPLTDVERSAKAAAVKAEADAAAAVVAAAKAKREEAEAASDTARQKRDAEARKAIAEADKAAADAQQAQVAALIPDFSKINIPQTKPDGDQGVLSSPLSHRAIRDAASNLVSTIRDHLPDDQGPVLITDDEDLVTSDAAYGEVARGLENLARAAVHLLPSAAAQSEGMTGNSKRTIAQMVGPLASAVVGALPGLISLVAPRHAISSRAIAADTTAAIAEVAGRLTMDEAISARRLVQIDDFRLVPAGPLVTAETDLRRLRGELVAQKLAGEQEKADRERLRAEYQGDVDDLVKARDDHPDAADAAQRQHLIDVARAKRDNAATELSVAAVKVGRTDNLLTTIDAFLLAIHTVPAGAKRSPFVSAAIREQLHVAEAATDLPRFSRVLFVKASGGSVDQDFKDKLVHEDEFVSLGSASISYWVMDPGTSNIVAAGVAVGMVRMKGKIDGVITVEPVQTS